MQSGFRRCAEIAKTDFRMRMLSFVLAIAAALASAPFGAEAQSARPSSVDLWNAYKQRFISGDGRLIDDLAGGVSHSEGQGYAMLLAEFADDRQTLDRLWSWTQTNLEIRGDGLAAWRWRPHDDPHVLDENNATDGDLLIAWALAEAGQRWNDRGYTRAAAKIARAIGSKLTFRSALGAMLRPGVTGFGPNDRDDGPVVNLSYWVFPAFDALERVAPDVDWPALRQSGLALLDAAKFGPAKLPSDWIALSEGVRPAGGFPDRFGYDAVRVPLYLAWGQPKQRGRLSELVQAWAGPDDTAPPVVDLDTGAKAETFADSGYRAVAAYARCVATGAPFPAKLRSVDFQRYYPATLHMLTLIALGEGHVECRM